MPNKTAVIKSFLEAKTIPDLARLYNHSMECQVNVAQDDGERIQGEFRGKGWAGYTKDGQTWKPFRIPFNAHDEPTYTDAPITWDIAEHAEGIGMTGWDWEHRVSKWVAFDFDAIAGHSDKHTSKLSTDELQRVREAACKLPWVTVRYSTGGRGLHLYVFLPDVPTNNHTEHSALARAILAKMSALVGFDFLSKVDICGGNMWVWHRKMRGNPNSLKLISEGEILEDIPPNWESHLEVIKGSRKTVKHNMPASNELPEIEEKFEQTAGQRTRIKLDDQHKKLIEWLHQNAKKQWWWDSDHHMLVTHTLDLKSAHDDMNLKGIFETTSSGTSEQNCFAFPMRRGGWSVRRYSLGCSEHASWDQDGKMWTKCYYNKEPTLRVAALSHDGLEDPSGGYVFYSLERAVEAALSVGAEIKAPAWLLGRKATIKIHKDKTRIVVEVPRETSDNSRDMAEWLEKNNKWIRIFKANLSSDSEIDIEDLDDFCRHVVTDKGGDAGWLLKTEDWWRNEPLNHIKSGIKTLGYTTGETEQIIGSSVMKPWILTCIPFGVEYPGDRRWNRNAPQLRHIPSSSENLSYPHWSMILHHVGQGLDLAVADDSWCKFSGILSGADYLKCWIASLFQYPTEPLPYLFIYSQEQNTGKSILHESLNLLFSPGYQRADHALSSTSSFNGELEGAVLCVVEETDLSKNQTAYNRIKDWVTSPIISIRPLHVQTYDVQNTTHWIQCSNDRGSFPMFPGDTRITMINVPERPKNLIPKPILLESLRKEAPDFLAEILNLEIPESNDRLRLPVVETQAKLDAANAHKNLVHAFIDDKCHYAPGYSLSLSEFYERFIAWLDPTQRHNWSTKQRVSMSMPDKFPKGRDVTSSQWHWGNISFTPPAEKREPFIAHNDKLITKEMI